MKTVENERNGFSASDVRISNMGSIEVMGVDEVVSYDDRSIVLVVCGTKTVIEGEGLRVTKLSVSDGVVFAVGKITALYCDEGKPEKKSILHGLFGA